MTAAEAREAARVIRSRNCYDHTACHCPWGLAVQRASIALDAFADGQDAAAREREACAKVADDYAVKHDGDRCSGGDMGRGHDGDAYRGAEDVAALIRARGAK